MADALTPQQAPTTLANPDRLADVASDLFDLAALQGATLALLHELERETFDLIELSAHGLTLGDAHKSASADAFDDVQRCLHFTKELTKRCAERVMRTPIPAYLADLGGLTAPAHGMAAGQRGGAQ